MNPSLTALIMSEVVLPGEPVDAKHPNLKLGPGLLQLSDGSKISTKAGTLCHNENRSKWLVESNSRRVSAKISDLSFCAHSDSFQYIPAAQESVIGVVVGKNGAEGFRVDIGGPHNANLDALAFEGATKRNRPNLKVVSISYFIQFLLTSLGRVFVVCTGFLIPQRYGTGARMFRCTIP